MKFAVVELQGNQYRVEEGTRLEVDRLNLKQGEVFFPEKVLLFAEGETILIGKPYLSEVKIKIEVIEDKKGEKIRVAKFKAKSRYRRVKGFRPCLTVIEIKSIILEKRGIKEESKTAEKKIVKKTISLKEKRE